LGEDGSAEHCCGNTTVSTKVATVLGANGHKQNTQTGTEVGVSQRKRRNTGRSKKRLKDQFHFAG